MGWVVLKRPSDQECAVHDDSCVAKAPPTNGMAQSVVGIKHQKFVVAEIRRQAAQPASDEFIVESHKFFGRWKGLGDQAVVYSHRSEMV